MRLSPPEPLDDRHDLTDFTSGEAELDDWFTRRALRNQMSGATRSFVVCCEGRRAVAYYALATGAVATQAATGRMRRNMPDPVPVVILARLAVDTRWQGKGLGRALIRDAAMRVRQAAHMIGIRGMLVHALTPGAKAFYERAGFTESPLDPMMLMATLGDLEATLA